MVLFLLEQGADLHQTEKRGWNMLHIAARNGMADKARLLLEHGINVHSIQNQAGHIHLNTLFSPPPLLENEVETPMFTIALLPKFFVVC
jgi:ankyrin repeat protein